MNLGSRTSFHPMLRTFLAILSIFSIGQTAGRAMVINLKYDASVTSMANAAQVEAAINLGAQALEVLYTNNIVVNITIMFTNNIDLGQSIFNLTGGPVYSDITNLLRAARTTTADSNSVASLPASDPTGGGTWLIPTAEAKALGGGYVATNDPGLDGTVQFASTVTYTYNPTNRGVAGEFDLTSVAEHEISEVLGRGWLLGVNISGAYLPYDLFRFTNNAARSFDINATSPYFSADNGVTVLSYFNPDVTAGDPQDWQIHSPADSFDYSLTDGQEGYLTVADLTSLDVLGYSLNLKVPKLSAKRMTNGAMQVTFTNVTGLNFSILASTNIATPIANWTVLGMPTETSVGNYQFIDANTNKARFYRARLN